MPSDPAHKEAVLDKLCTPAAAEILCQSGVCSSNGPSGAGLCGYADGAGPCTPATGSTLCQSGACSVDDACEPAGGCNVDGDCPSSDWCSPASSSCVPKLADGAPVPVVAGHAPPLTGTCTTAVGLSVCACGVCDGVDNACGLANGDGPCTVASGGSVCRSGVCDGADDKCGYADGDGPCTVTSGPTLCRSGTCSTNGTCEPAGGCNVDADCPAADYCNANLCVPKAGNGSPVPKAPGHQPPLTGTCTPAAGASACASAVCDTADNDCGYANGDGPCTVANGGVVCRSSVCDATDGKCGYADGDGPCTTATGTTVCRSTACSANGTCEPAGGCNVDADCPAADYCDVSTCVAKAANGSPVPTAPGHQPPLTGTCNGPAALAACASGVCDTDNSCGLANSDGPCTAPTGGVVCRSGVCDTDGKCGYADGDGPCTTGSGATVCRSTSCAATGPNQGTCVACTTDAACSGATPACSATTNTCVQCTAGAAGNASACTGASPVCDASSSTCVPCNGDLGSGSADACVAAGTPFCFLAGPLQGQCGKCATDADCAGHPSGNTCNTVAGTCYEACHSDADCTAQQWCDGPTGGAGACVPKLANGTPLPAAPASVATCSTAVGLRVCVSTVCDPKDNTCGFATGDGPCAGDPECRNMLCDPVQHTCTGCATDSDCPADDFCAPDGACTLRLPTGSTCDRSAQCQGDLCLGDVCSAPVGSGNGATCAARGTGSSGSEGAAGVLGLVLAAILLSRRAGR